MNWKGMPRKLDGFWGSCSSCTAENQPNCGPHISPHIWGAQKIVHRLILCHISSTLKYNTVFEETPDKSLSLNREPSKQIVSPLV